MKSRNDIRVATYPTVTGEKIVLRLFSTASVKTFEEIAFPESAGQGIGKISRPDQAACSL